MDHPRSDPERKPPLAYFISFRTYGTWLPGDARGSVHASRNEWASEFMPVRRAREEKARSRMRELPLVLDMDARAVAERTIGEVCAYRGWEIRAINVRTNHVHVVVAAPVEPEQVVTDLKAWCTRRLVEAGLVVRGAKVWARHGSTRYLWDVKAVADACEYVVNGQD